MLIGVFADVSQYNLDYGPAESGVGYIALSSDGKRSMTVLPVDLAQYAHKPDLGLPVEILSIATANPRHKVSQSDALKGAAAIYPQFERLHGLFSNTGIDYRYTCKPNEWYQQPHTWEERTEFSRPTRWIFSSASRSRPSAPEPDCHSATSMLSSPIQSPASRFRASMPYS